MRIRFYDHRNDILDGINQDARYSSAAWTGSGISSDVR